MYLFLYLFFVSAPISSIDFSITNGLIDIPIEERDEKEVSTIYGVNSKGEFDQLLIAPKNSKCKNFSFDVTPAKYITKIITEKKVIDANTESILDLK